MSNEASPAQSGPDASESMTELAELRAHVHSELAAIRAQAQSERLNRAEKYADYMRNWLGILTVTVSVAFLGFGYVGITRWSDIEAYRKQMKADADAVSSKATEVETYRRQMKEEADDVSSKAKAIDSIVKSAEQQSGSLNEKFQDLRSGLESRVQKLQESVQKLQERTEKTLALAQQSRLDTKNLQVNLVDFAGTIPVITQVPIAITPSTVLHIEGGNFGNSRGRLYAYVTYGGGGPVIFESGRAEIQPSSIREWSDRDITFVLSTSDYRARQSARQDAETRSKNIGAPPPFRSSYVSFEVARADGKSSGESSTSLWEFPTNK